MQDELVLPAADKIWDRLRGDALVPLVDDLGEAVAALVAGALGCPTAGCGGRLRPWGWARLRQVRVAINLVETHRPRRGYCRDCRHSHVLSDLATYPRRLDTAQAVTTALVAASEGLGYRRVAEVVDRPVSTVRDWLHRARGNAGVVLDDARVGFYRLERDPGRIEPRGDLLADMVHVVGLTAVAWARRYGPGLPPAQLVAYLTRVGILTSAPQPRWSSPI